jgi:hypothetical protein
MGGKHGWHHSGIPDIYPNDALDLKTIYMSVHAGEAKKSGLLMQFLIQRSLIF